MIKTAILASLAALAAASEKFVLTSTADGENIYYVYVGARGPPSDLDPHSYEELSPRVLKKNSFTRQNHFKFRRFCHRHHICSSLGWLMDFIRLAALR